MPPGKTTASPKVKIQTWYIWRHKKEGWVTSNVQDYLKDVYRFDPSLGRDIKTPSPFNLEDFESLNPNDFTFKAHFNFNDIRLGRSDVQFVFTDLATNKTYPMLRKEFVRVFKTSYFSKGEIIGLWKFVKHGSTISISLVKELDDHE